MGYKVTNPSAGVWHYEYALYNENLDRAIQSFSVPLSPGVNISNIGFHAPPQEPGWANDGTQNNRDIAARHGLLLRRLSSITWNTETFAQNQNANAIRWGHSITSVSMPTNRRRLPMQQSVSSRQARR